MKNAVQLGVVRGNDPARYECGYGIQMLSFRVVVILGVTQSVFYTLLGAQQPSIRTTVQKTKPALKRISNKMETHNGVRWGDEHHALPHSIPLPSVSLL